MSKAARRRAKKSAPTKAHKTTTLLSTTRRLGPGDLVVRIANAKIAPIRRDNRLLLVLSVVKAKNCIPQYLCQYCDDTQRRRYFLPHQITRYDE